MKKRHRGKGRVHIDMMASVRDSSGRETGKQQTTFDFKDAKVLVEDTRDYDGVVMIRVHGLNPNAPGLKEDGVTHGVIAEGGYGMKGD